MKSKLSFVSGLFLSIALILPSGFADAAKIVSAKVKTKYLLLSDISLDGLDVFQLEAQFVIKDMKLLKKELTTTTSDSGCNAINKKIGKKEAYKNHYYKMSFSDPAPLMIVKTAGGKVIYAQEIFPGISPEDRFGTGCMSSQVSLDKALKENNRTYKPEIFINKMKKETGKRLKKDLKTMFVPEYRKTKFKLFSAKGSQYQDLDTALQSSRAAYGSILKTPLTANDKAALEKAIGLWEKALEEKDLNNKEARINKKLAIRLHHNVAMNAMAIHDYSKAIEHLQKIKRIWAGNSFSGGAVDPNRYIEVAMVRERRYKLSPKTADDTQKLLARIEEIKKASRKIPCQS